MNIRPICVVQTSLAKVWPLSELICDPFFPASQASSLLKHVTGTASLQGHADSLLDASVRHFSSAPSAQSASTEENGYAVGIVTQLCSVTPCKLLAIADLQSDSSRFKGHGMLAPFTAGWQSNDLHPLIIERSEVATLNFRISFCSIKLWKSKFRMPPILLPILHLGPVWFPRIERN